MGVAPEPAAVLVARQPERHDGAAGLEEAPHLLLAALVEHGVARLAQHPRHRVAARGQRRELRGHAGRPRLGRHVGVHLVDELPLLPGHRAAHDGHALERGEEHEEQAPPAHGAPRVQKHGGDPEPESRGESRAQRDARGGRALEARVQASRERLHQPKRLAQREGQRLRRRRRCRRHGRGGYEGTGGFDRGWERGEKVRTRTRERGPRGRCAKTIERRGPHSSRRVPRERIDRGARRSRVRSVSRVVASAGRTTARGAERRTRAAHVRAHRSLA